MLVRSPFFIAGYWFLFHSHRALAGAQRSSFGNRFNGFLQTVERKVKTVETVLDF